eukprot:CAMPEP_0167798970 /NCGR_PEP_ID=MMETSP0111_2-20121227/16688_1 /TAXON_ID=91324 /ORGANISM="Lotharella globosa, Strain CCCM811" /LENGTH=92 /DNA_ID=CAMNT_0007693611 /DNA_START=277 /DNA_END=552 /DNA_ORIENTATION=-
MACEPPEPTAEDACACYLPLRHHSVETKFRLGVQLRVELLHVGPTCQHPPQPVQTEVAEGVEEGEEDHAAPDELEPDFFGEKVVRVQVRLLE